MLGVRGARRGRVPSCRARRRTRRSRSHGVRCCSRWRVRSAKRGPEICRGDALVRRAFRAKHADESHRARLRVEIGRLRAELRSLASVSATARGFALAPRSAREVVVLAPPVEDQHAAVIAFLADGESWSSSALALALGASHAPCSGRSIRLRQQARCNRTAAGEHAAG